MCTPRPVPGLREASCVSIIRSWDGEPSESHTVPTVGESSTALGSGAQPATHNGTWAVLCQGPGAGAGVATPGVVPPRPRRLCSCPRSSALCRSETLVPKEAQSLQGAQRGTQPSCLRAAGERGGHLAGGGRP